MMPRRRLWSASAVLLLGGCATAAVQADVELKMARRQLAARAEIEARDAVGARLRAWCAGQPAACQVRWWAERLPTRLHWFRTAEPIPPYAVSWEIIEGEMRPRVEATLGESYDWAVLRMVFEQWDRGEWTDEQAKSLLDYHYRQRQEVAGQHERLFQLRLANAQAQDVAAFAAALGVVALGLNTYAATLRPIPPSPRPAPTAPAARAATVPRPSIVHCTYGLWALGGRQLCVRSDGSVVSQTPPSEFPGGPSR